MADSSGIKAIAVRIPNQIVLNNTYIVDQSKSCKTTSTLRNLEVKDSALGVNRNTYPLLVEVRIWRTLSTDSILKPSAEGINRYNVAPTDISFYESPAEVAALADKFFPVKYSTVGINLNTLVVRVQVEIIGAVNTEVVSELVAARHVDEGCVKHTLSVLIQAESQEALGANISLHVKGFALRVDLHADSILHEKSLRTSEAHSIVKGCTVWILRSKVSNADHFEQGVSIKTAFTGSGDVVVGIAGRAHRLAYALIHVVTARTLLADRAVTA